MTREQVIKGLQAIDAYFRESFNAMDGTLACELFHEWSDVTKQAIGVLKAQEPRVMMLEEALGAEVNVDQCWLEVRCIKQIYLADAVVCPEHPEMADIQRWGATDCQLPLDLYGEYWRMWTSHPTEAEREATPWQ